MAVVKRVYGGCKKVMAFLGIRKKYAATPSEEYQVMRSAFDVIGDNWSTKEGKALPVAVVWGTTGKQERTDFSSSRAFSGYRTAFARPVNLWTRQKAGLDRLSDFVFFNFAENLPFEVTAYLKERNIGIRIARAVTPAEEHQAMQGAFDIIGDNWSTKEEKALPIAVVWGATGKQEQADWSSSRAFSGYRTAFAQPVNSRPWPRVRLDRLPDFVFFSFVENLPLAVTAYLKERNIDIRYMSFQELIFIDHDGDISAESPRYAGIFPTGRLNWKDGEPERRPLLVAGAPEHLRRGLAASLKSWSVFFDPDPISANGSDGQEGHPYDALERMDGLAVALWKGAAREPLAAFIDRQACPLYLLQEGMLRGTSSPGEVSRSLSYVFLPLKRDGSANTAPLDLAYAGLLNAVNFENMDESLEDSASLMKVMRALEISRDNPPPQIASCRQGYLCNYAGRRRVLVVGEALPDLEDNARRIAEARKLYPESEILYLPHPSETADAAQNLQGQDDVTVIDDYGRTAWLLENVDGVLVHSSGLGLEAIWHGCEVHVFGPAFYAGWGLTIDHAPQPDRRRTLTREQLFCGIYLLGCQYRLGGDGDPVRNMLATLFEISYKRSSAFDLKLTPEYVVDNMPDLARSQYSPVLLRTTTRDVYRKKHNTEFFKELLSSTLFSLSGGAIYQETAACCALGLLGQKSPEYFIFFTSLLSMLPLESYSRIFASIAPMEGPARVNVWRYSIREARGEFDQAIALRRQCGSGWASAPQSVPGQEDEPDRLAPKYELGFPRDASLGAIFDLAGLELERRNFEAALKLYYLLLAQGEPPLKILPSILKIARLRFDFRSLPALGRLLFYLHEPSQLPEAQLQLQVQDQLYQVSGVRDETAALKALIQYAVWGRQHLTTEVRILDPLIERFGELPYAPALYDLAVANNPEGVLDTCSNLIALGQFGEAVRRLEAYKPTETEYPHYSILLARVCGLRGQHGRAKKILTEATRRFPAHETLRLETMNFIVKVHDMEMYDEWNGLLHKYYRGPMSSSFFPVFWYLTDDFEKLRSGWQNVNIVNMQRVFRRYFSEKLIGSFEQAIRKKVRRLLVYAPWGPGDELTNIHYYRPIKQALAELGIEAAFTCGHRLHTLFCRSYPDLKIIPSYGLLNVLQIKDFSLFDKLPGLDLCQCLSNDVYEAIQEYDALIMNFTAIHETFAVSRSRWEQRLSFSQHPFIKPDPELVRHWHDRLRPLRQSGKPLVGVNWRSSHNTWADDRNEHYLSAREIFEVLETDEAVFINLQVGHIRRELAWLERRLPRPLVHFPDLDQFNDFENTAAMFEGLDYIISPWTAPSHLAGGLGVPVLYFRPTYMDKNLVTPGKDTSIYYPATRYIFPDTPNDKESLLKNLKQALLAAVRSGGWKQRRAAVEEQYSLRAQPLSADEKKA